MKINFEELVYLKALLEIEGLGPAKILNLISKFHSPKNVFVKGLSSLSKTELISTILSKRIISKSKRIKDVREKLERELESLNKHKFRLITYFDKEYPEILKNIYFPPILLYLNGIPEEKDYQSVAIVGTRTPTPYGKGITEKISGELSEQKVTIVSGLARGIDSIAHRTALKYYNRTISVIGSGLDKIYPPENKNLAEQISENGAVISEYPLGTNPDAQNFPRRNRIISGLSLGTLVIETRLNGGAMQTAAYALEQNREVFAVPGNLDVKQSEGTNILIQKGEAKLVKNAEDILIELDLKLKPEVGRNIPKPSVDLNMFEEKILNVLNHEPMQIDKISEASTLSTSDCLVNLLSLEFKGLVKQLPGKQFSKVF